MQQSRSEERHIPAGGPVVGVSALISAPRGVLLIRRGPGVLLAGRWTLPGGKVDPGERLRAALRREVVEETGLRVSVGDLAGFHEQLPGSGIDGHYLILVFSAEVTGGTLCAGDDADAAEWVQPGLIKARRTTPGLLKVLRDAGVPA
ncbi:MAG TPA: NUDIX domain-containing protein [Actinomycetota bacterium]|nr:NUDIX domain-containing protein [Actinomycetota bacterium]